MTVFAVGCTFPTRSTEFSCFTDSECSGFDDGRVCREGFCVLGSEVPDAGGVTDPDAAVDAPPDADPFEAIRTACLAAGYTEEPATGGLYRVITTQDGWVAAQTDCNNDVANATHLIVLSSDAEVAFMKTNLGSWIGLTDRGAEANNNPALFKNVTNEANDKRPFASGQPDNGGGNENCVQMKTTDGLDDDQCGNGHKYVCECDGKTPTTL